MSERRKTLLHLFHLVLGALILRIVYMLLAADHATFEEIYAASPDMACYRIIAENFFLETPRGIDALFKVGPGYGLMQAGLLFFFGQSLIPAFILNISLGSLAPAVIYLLAYYLTDRRNVALVSGIIGVLSPTAIALSCNALSDVPFFLFHSGALLCFVVGFRRGGWKWFVTAGLLAGWATYVRGVGQFWPFIFLALPPFVPVTEVFRSRYEMIKRSALTGLVMLVMILAWSARNYVAHDVFVFGSNGINAATAYLGARAVADNSDSLDVRDVRRMKVAANNEYFAGKTPTFADRYHRSRQRLWQLTMEHPDWMARAFFKTVWANVKGGNYIAKTQVPLLEYFWWRTIIYNREGLAPVLVIISLLGLAFLFYDKKLLAGILLGCTYVYFTLITGFSFWQGSRLHYPAEMAWSILLAYALCWITGQVGSRSVLLARIIGSASWWKAFTGRFRR